jgi:hypothetical protein
MTDQALATATPPHREAALPQISLVPPARPARRFARERLAALVAILTAASAWKFRPPDRHLAERWLKDYREMREALSAGYAHLEWTVERGQPSLVEMDRKVREALNHAHSDREARWILRTALRSFGDGHMGLLPASVQLDPPDREGTLSRYTSPERACSCLNYDGEREAEFPFNLKNFPGFRPLGGLNTLSAGVLDFEGRRFGLLRIDSFDERNFRDTCRREWRRYREMLTGTCGEDCRDDFRLRVTNRLIDQLESRIRQLSEAGAQILVVDVTDNGGGYDWYAPSAQLLSGHRLSPLRASYVKSGHTLGSLRYRRKRILEYLARRDTSAAQRPALEVALCRVDDLIAEAQMPCWNRLAWQGRSRQAGCSNLTSRELYGSGILDHDEGSPLPLEIERLIYFQGIYRPVQPAWRGPVAVLVDNDTASAAEFFAGALKFQAGAVLLGRHTASTGGGWSFWREPWQLPNSKLNLYMPDTVEYWPDGSDSREGLEPDVPVRWLTRAPEVMGRQLLKALRALNTSASPTAEVKCAADLGGKPAARDRKEKETR